MPNPRKTCSLEESGAFIEVMEIEPYASGPLDGLRFAVKDVIDLAGHQTGCGNPDWARTHPVAVVNAVCVDQLLLAGAHCVGKTVCDELAFSLDGENFFYGTPLNPRAPERVAGRLLQRLGRGGGLRPGGFRPGHRHRRLGAGPGQQLRPLRAAPLPRLHLRGRGRTLCPHLRHRGRVAASAEILVRAAAVLLSCQVPARVEPAAVYLVQEAWDIADPEVQEALAPTLKRLRRLWGSRVKETSMRPIDNAASGSGLQTWYQTYCTIQWAEIWSSLGAWVEAVKPEFGPRTRVNFELTRTVDRSQIGPAGCRREEYCRSLQNFLGPKTCSACPPPRPWPR